MAAHSRPLPQRSLRLLSLNVNGLSGRSKRRTLFAGLARLRHDVVVLQETHLTSDKDGASALRAGAGAGRPWGGRGFWCHAQTAARGVAVLFRPGFDGDDIKKEFADTHGRVLRVGWRDGRTGQRWSVVAVYAPNAASEQAVFFGRDGPVAQALRAGPTGAEVVVLGDFNCIIDAHDTSSPAPAAGAQARTAGAAALRSLIVGNRLVDAWQQCRARGDSVEGMPFTHIATNGTTARRLDRGYISADFATAVGLLSCRHLPLGELPGDHCPVELCLAAGGGAARVAAPARWRLPLDLLSDAAFAEEVEEEAVCMERGHGRGWEEFAMESAMSKWLRFKNVVRALARRAMAERRRAHEARRASLVRGVQRAATALAAAAAAAAAADAAAAVAPAHMEAREGPPPDTAAAARRVREQAGRLRAHDARNARTDAAKADAVWHRYGEKPTFWFHRLGEPHKPTPPMTVVEHPVSGAHIEAVSVAAARRGAEAVAAYFDGDRPGGLFAPAHTDPQASAALLSRVDKKLSPAAAAASDGPNPDGSLGEDELRAAMCTMHRGKSPGLDGLPYEFYHAFWDVVAGPLAKALNEAYLGPGDDPAFPQSFSWGLITLIFKGTADKPLPGHLVSSYRPITLLNADYKIAAKAIALRMAPALDQVVDDTQTAFIPGRWIGDNVLCHMGVIDALAPDGPGLAGRPPATPATTPSAGGPPATPAITPSAGDPPAEPGPGDQHASGCILFLDFEKAYDRVARGWIMACIEALGFTPRLRRWVTLLLGDTHAVASFGGALSRPFAVRAGAAQGSPLSPLLYVAAAQPLAAALRHLQSAGTIDAVRLPGGAAAPASHQHADDTSIHTATVEGAMAALHHAVLPFCAASGSAINLSKCVGLTLGSHPPLEGLHHGSGITFAGPSSVVKHLGVHLTKGDRAAASDAMWRRRLRAVAASVQHWDTVDLTLLGRVHVAKQVMASTLTYHATFVEPPAQFIASVTRLIDSFVMGRPVDVEGTDAVVRGSPPATVMALPLAEGGLAAVDVGAQATALRARVAARLLHPQRRPWKRLAAAAFEAALPGVGVAALLTALQPSRAVQRGLPPRLASYWKALQATRLHRLQRPEGMTPQQVRIEPLAGNRCVAAAAGGRPAVPWAAAVSAWGAARRLRDLVAGPDGALPAALPEAWTAKLQLPSPPSEWEASNDGGWVRYVRPGAARLFRVSAEGRLLDAGGDAQPPEDGWQDCCVVACPLTKGRPAGARAPLPPVAPGGPGPGLVHPGHPDLPQQQHQGQNHDQNHHHQQQQQQQPPPGPAREDLYLVGPWESVGADPSLWGHAGTPLTHLTVKEATLRLKRLDAVARLRGAYSPAEAVAPALWGAPPPPSAPAHGAVEALAARQQTVFAAKLARAPPAGAGRRVPDAELAAAYRQPWMDPSPPRASPAERAAARAGHAAGGRAGAPPAPPSVQGQARGASSYGDDSTDPLGVGDTARPEWRRVWRRAHAKWRPRHHRCFDFLVLHAALPCGGARVVRFPVGGEGIVEAVCCSHAACRPAEGPPPLETLQHALLECPAVRPALRWLAQLWRWIDGGTGPPLSAAVWLQQDPTSWQPSQQHARLWTALRTTLLCEAWRLRTRRVATGVPFTPREVVEGCVREVHDWVLADWQRAVSRVTALPGTHASWFPGRSPAMTVVEFEVFWCPSSAIAHVSHPQAAGAKPTLEFRLQAPTADELTALEAEGGAADAAGGGGAGGTAAAT